MSRSRNGIQSANRSENQGQSQQRQNPELSQHKSSSAICSQFSLNDRFDTQFLRLKMHEHVKTLHRLFGLSQNQLSQAMASYQTLPYSPIDLPRLLQFEKCKLIKHSDSKIYLGQTYDKKKHGLGVALYKDTKIYQGHFQNNQRSGYGVEVYKNGNIYLGNFERNKKHGKGVFFWFSLAAIPCTKNAQILIQQYKGKWWGGLPDGQGQHYKANGDTYVGQFKNGLKHGKGIQNYCNDDIYEGQFINGLPQGYGHYIWKDNSQYKGDFKQGYRNGYGTWKNKEKSQVYQGHYMLDKKHGYGIYTWDNGHSYKGNYIQDVRSGLGKLFYQDQVVQEGLWLNGQKQQPFQSKIKQSHMLEHNQSNVTAKTKSSNLKSGLFSSKQKIQSQNSLEKRHQKQNSVQNLRTPSPMKKRPDTYCISFKQQKMQEKSRIGHRNCVPCNILGRKQKVPSSTSKNKQKIARSTSKSKI